MPSANEVSARRGYRYVPPENPTSLITNSRQAWTRLVVAVLIGTLGSVGMWAVVVVLPVVQTEFSATRGAVSLASTMNYLGFALGGVVTGRITDRFGVVAALGLSIACLGVSFVLAGAAASLWQFNAVYFLIGLGTSATFAPLMAETSHWFERYRGLAVAIVASGMNVAGTIWPPLINRAVQSVGWRRLILPSGSSAPSQWRPCCSCCARSWKARGRAIARTRRPPGRSRAVD